LYNGCKKNQVKFQAFALRYSACCAHMYLQTVSILLEVLGAVCNTVVV